LIMLDNVEILVVEMSPQTSPSLSGVLARCCPDARVWETTDPVAAMEYLLGCGGFAGRDERSQPALVLLRCAPLLDDGALALLSSIRSFAATRLIPVVIVAPRPDNATLRRCHHAGVNSVVADSGDPAVLASTMASVHAFWSQANETLSFPPIRPARLAPGAKRPV
jgi:CheY-like chemotaxis protein